MNNFKRFIRKGIAIKYASRLLLVVVTGLAMLGSLPAPIQADDDYMDLVLGGEGATSWSMGNVMPCDSGTKTVTLHNDGTLDGTVIIWVGTVQSGEGENPESETDTTGGGELDDNLLLDLHTDPPGKLKTNLSLPTTINDFPQSDYEASYIWIDPLDVGETVTLYWEWELPCATGNDVQGDTLSFTMVYFLVDEPPSLPPTNGGSDNGDSKNGGSKNGGGGGGGGGGFGGGGDGAKATCFLEINMLGELTRVNMGCCSNRALASYLASDPDNEHFMEIKKGMEITCGDCEGCYCYPRVIVMSLSTEAPPLPDDMTIVGPVYDFTGYKDLACTIPCELATHFDPPVIIQLSYDSALLPEGAFEPVIGFYDDELGEWVTPPSDTGRVAEVGKLTVVTDYIASQFAVLVTVPPPAPAPSPPPPPPLAPAHFVVSSLNIEPSVSEMWQPVTFMTKTGESVTITASVANDGGQAGTYTVELKLNGETVDSEVVTLDAGQSKPVSFTLSGMEPGQYEVAVPGLTGEFTVSRTINWWLIGGTSAALLILLSWLIWNYRKKIRNYRKKLRNYIKKVWHNIKKVQNYIKKVWHNIKKSRYFRKKKKPAAVLRVSRSSHS